MNINTIQADTDPELLIVAFHVLFLETFLNPEHQSPEQASHRPAPALSIARFDVIIFILPMRRHRPEDRKPEQGVPRSRKARFVINRK